MPPLPKIGLVGDYDASVPAHQAIPLALRGQAEVTWLPTESIDSDAVLESFDGLWCVPASPYRSMDGALRAIRFARETYRPFLGTCGGFQHAVIEYARNVLGWADAEHAETAPEAARPVISALACSLVEAKGSVRFTPDSRIAGAYGTGEATEGYRCRYGLNPEFREALMEGSMHITAVDEEGEVRGIELTDHPFFVATLFQPERAALDGTAVPLASALALACTGPRQTEPMAHYLAHDEVIDWRAPSLQAFLDQTGWRGLSEAARTQAAYGFVRDEVPHAWDVESDVVTCRASDVFKERVGICYAKSHLLAALLRGMGIPAGLCYQRLILFDDPEDGFALHALNAAFLDGRWIRFDARGNKPGVNAEFSRTDERLAFPVRPELGEVDELVVHARPLPSTVAVLQGHAKMTEVYQTGLPSRLE